jgi:hypothetical protein
MLDFFGHTSVGKLRRAQVPEDEDEDEDGTENVREESAGQNATQDFLICPYFWRPPGVRATQLMSSR